MTTAAHLDRDRIAAVHRAERERFARDHPRSRELFERARGSLVSGVPMTWMAKWVGGRHPVYAASAHGASVADVDGHRYMDFALGDTGAMAGHSLSAAVAAIERRLRKSVVQLGARAELAFAAEPPRCGGASAALHATELEDSLHLFMLNRGVLITPFHNMALMCPATTEVNVDRHTDVFAEAVDALAGRERSASLAMSSGRSD